MFSPTVLDHFQNPRNARDLPPPALRVEVENPVCGDTLRLSAIWRDGKVAEVGYTCRGCAAAIAAGSVLTELLQGATAAEAARIDAAAVEAALGGLPATSRHAAALCAAAVNALVSG